MFRFFSSRNLISLDSLPNRNHNNVFRIRESITNFLRLLQTLALKSHSSTTCNSKNQDNPTVSYLVNKCGLALDSAISASKQVTLTTTTTQKPDSVLELFKSYGFTQTQITDIITKCPSVLVADPDKTLNPRLEFFLSLGLSKPDLLRIMFSNQQFLGRSLTNTIIPTLDFLKSILHTNENVLTTLKHWSYIAFRNFRIEVEPNVLTLRSHGVPESNISKFLMSHPRAFVIRNDFFQDRVRKVEEMGFRPNSLGYLRAVQVMASVSELNWEKKVSVLKSFGWSDMDIIVAFKKQMLFMDVSEEKIRILMDFYLNKLCLDASETVKCPSLLMLSLEKRVIPRCSVLQLLLSKGLIESDLNIVQALDKSKTRFDKQFVTKYQEIIPEIVSVYRGEKGVPAFEATQFAAMIGFKNLQEIGSNSKDH